MTIYGYARVSTVQQDVIVQIDSLLNHGIAPENIYSDEMAEAKMDRKSLKVLLKKVDEGDTIIVKKLDRLGRSLSQVTGLIEELTSKGIYVKSLDDDVDTSDDSAVSKAMLQLLAMFAEMERNFIMERTKPAIENAKNRGVKFGRPKANKQVYDLAVQDYLVHGMKAKEIIQKYGKDSGGKDLITEATLFRRVREARKEMEEGR